MLAEELATRAGEADRQGQLPAEDIARLKETGYFSLSVPKMYGGLELSLKECVATQLELAQGSASTAMVAGMPVHIFGSARESNPWSEEAFEMLCRASVGGGLINSVASEPALGSLRGVDYRKAMQYQIQWSGLAGQWA